MSDLTLPGAGVEVREQGEVTTAGEPVSDPFLLDDQIPGDRVVIVGQPHVEAAEESRSAQTFDTLVEYSVPRGQAAMLVEVAANIDSNGEVRFALPGNEPFSFTGSIDVNLPVEGAVLGGGDTVRLTHQSTDGTSSTQRATIVAKEV